MKHSSDPGPAPDSDIAKLLARVDEAPKRRRTRFFPPEAIPLPVALGLAAVGYPLVWVPIAGLYYATTVGLLADVGSLFTAIGLSLLVGLIVGLGSGWLAMVVAFVLWQVAQLAVRSMKIRLSPDLLGAHVGSWTVLAILLFVTFSADLGLRESWNQQPSDVRLVMLLLVPGVGTLVGQYIGAWSQWSMGPVASGQALRQFGIFQLMVATAWLAGGLAVLKLLGLLEMRPLIFLGGWVVYQAITLPFVVALCRRRNRAYWRRWEGRGGDGGGMRG